MSQGAVEALEQKLGLFRHFSSLPSSAFLTSSRALVSSGSLRLPDSVTIEEHAELSRLATIQSLRLSESFYIRAEITNLLKNISASFPRSAVFRENLLPTSSGFCWTERPVLLSENPQVRLTGFSWCRDSDLADVLLHPLALIVPWIAASNGPVPYGFIHLTFGSVEMDSWEDPWLSFAKFFLTFTTFLDQKILQAREDQPYRASRRRLARIYTTPPTVRIIELRKKVNPDYIAPKPTQHLDWQFRWIVSGHWRDQWLPSKQTHEPRWISPYLKGPDDKPLRMPSVPINVVVR